MQDIQDSQRALFVAVEDDKHLGWCRTGWNDMPAGALAPSGYYVRGLRVVPAARRRGLGTLLLRVAAEDALSLAPEVRSFYGPDNVASAVTHARVGFREEARGRLGVPGTSPDSDDVLVCLHRQGGYITNP